MQGVETLVIRSADDLAALAEEWNRLAARCPGYYLSQTFQWAQTAWETVARPRGRELNCVAMFSEGRLVAVWPLVVYRDRGIRRLHPLGFEGSEYSGPLIEPGDDAPRWIAVMWRVAARAADLAILPHVRVGSLLADVLRDGGQWSVADDALDAPYVARADFPDWTAYHRSISGNLRSQIRRMRRRLAERGEVVVERASVAGCAALIDWMIDHKQRWLARSNLSNDWIARPDYRDFLVALAAREDALGGIALFALKVDGVPIAAYLVSVDRSRAEYFLAAYDHEWAFYKPGHTLTEHVVRWAFERGLDFDFRIGAEPYKYKWTTRNCDTVTWHVATGRRGIPMVAGLRAAMLANRIRRTLGLGRFLPPKWRHRLKSRLTRRAVVLPAT